MSAGRRPLIRALAELILAAAAAVGCAVSCLQVQYAVLVAPVLDGEPETVSIGYHPRPLLLALVLATAAGVLAVVGTARLRRARRNQTPIYPTGVLSAR